MTCNVIATGSKGNAVLLDGTILLDCGVPYKLIKPYVRRLKLVLLTHIHGDHFNQATIRRLHKERPTLRFGCCEWLAAPLLDAGINARYIDVFFPDLTYTYGADLRISPFWLIHDVQNCGYRILYANEEKALYATDTGSMDNVSAKGYDLYMIEANFTKQELDERIRRKTESGEFIYEHRAAATHLSREAADLWLMDNASRDSKVIYLHQHEEPKGE